MQNIECIIFDCDGVLVDTETIMISVLLEMAAIPGTKIDIKEAVKLFSGRQILETIKMLEDMRGTPFPENFEQHFRQRAYDEFKRKVKPIDGVLDLLQTISVPYCVASSGPREKIELNLQLTGILPFFDAARIFSSYEIGSWKPDPGIFLHAAKAMSFLPSQCIVIEDSLAGVEAGVRGGFRVFALANDHNKEELGEKGAVVFNKMSELPQLLGNGFFKM
ncbi:MAG TPA: HAD-IA family hydrolase [Pseudosphingobacterium sp.]|nr:HAD-IA family hydrolase [Pseudosphingobacterium sp.]